MQRIINDCAEFGQMLHRSLSHLYEHVRDFHVAVSDDGKVIGCCGLSIVWANLAEVYSLAVAPGYRGQGLGRSLVQACIDESRRLGIHQLMTLTYEQAFFARLGFEVIDRQRLPLKVWSECLRCSKNQACDEIAMVLEHADLPDLSPPPSMESVYGEGRYEVPVTLTVGRSAPNSVRPKMNEAH